MRKHTELALPFSAHMHGSSYENLIRARLAYLKAGSKRNIATDTFDEYRNNISIYYTRAQRVYYVSVLKAVFLPEAILMKITIICRRLGKLARISDYIALSLSVSIFFGSCATRDLCACLKDRPS